MKVPAFLLRRLYVKGSLRSTGDGFEFQLMNKLGSGYARRLMPLTVDGEELPMQSTTFEVDGRRATFDEVTEETPFTLAMNKTTTIAYSGEPLPEGPHTIGMRFEVAGLGEMAFDFSDIATNNSGP